MHRSHTQINTSLQIPLCLIQERPLELDRMFKYVARDPESRKERKGRDKRLMSVLLLSVALVSGVCVNLCCLSISSSCLSLLLYQSFFFIFIFLSTLYPPLDPIALLHCSLSSLGHELHQLISSVLLMCKGQVLYSKKQGLAKGLDIQNYQAYISWLLSQGILMKLIDRQSKSLSMEPTVMLL